MEVRLLGPLELADGGRSIAYGGARQRAVLALLVLHANQVVASERVLMELWGEDAPPGAANALQAAVSRLRRALPQGRLVTRPPGYLFRAFPDEVDLSRFERLLAQGRQALADGAAAEAADTLADALALWRGPALADFRYEPFAQAEIARLEELRLVCVEERVEADLALGAGAELVGELQRLVAEQPLRERLRGQLMLALYRSGRQAEALEAYREVRELLLEELGLEPAPALGELEGAILRHDPALRTAPAPPPAAAAVPARKPVTVLCAELEVASGSGAALDPEALRVVLERAQAILGATLERHGGRLSALAGRRIVGVFGVPTLHEDDALRAAQAALAAKGALEAEAAALEERGLALAMRVGLATGEALVGGPEPSGFAGDAVGQADELAQRAAAGEILVGDQTRRLAAAALEVEPAGGGRFRLLAAPIGARPLPVRLDAPLVGRVEELARLRDGLARAVRDGQPVLATVLGEAGIGKSRLVHELAAQARGRGDGAHGPLPALRRRHHLLAPARAGRPGRGAARGPARSWRRCWTARPTRPGWPSGWPGRSARDGPGTLAAPEIFWATRRLLETLARRRPLVVVLEDLHWAEPTFLDLAEAVATQARQGLLLVCLARPELLERRPAWAAGAAAGDPGRAGAAGRGRRRRAAGGAGRRAPEASRGGCSRSPPATRCSWSSWPPPWASSTGARASPSCRPPSRPCWPPAWSCSARASGRCCGGPPSSAATSPARPSPSCCPPRPAARSGATCGRWPPRGWSRRRRRRRAPRRGSTSTTCWSSRRPTAPSPSRTGPSCTSASPAGPRARRPRTRSSATTSSRRSATGASWARSTTRSGAWPAGPPATWRRPGPGPMPAATSRPRSACSSGRPRCSRPDDPARARAQTGLGAALMEAGRLDQADRALADAGGSPGPPATSGWPPGPGSSGCCWACRSTWAAPPPRSARPCPSCWRVRAGRRRGRALPGLAAAGGRALAAGRLGRRRGRLAPGGGPRPPGRRRAAAHRGAGLAGLGRPVGPDPGARGHPPLRALPGGGRQPPDRRGGDPQPPGRPVRHAGPGRRGAPGCWPGAWPPSRSWA